MFKKRTKRLDIFEEQERSQERLATILESKKSLKKIIKQNDFDQQISIPVSGTLTHNLDPSNIQISTHPTTPFPIVQTKIEKPAENEPLIDLNQAKTFKQKKDNMSTEDVISEEEDYSFKCATIEDELLLIIKEALENTSNPSKVSYSDIDPDIDPDLMGLVKSILLSNQDSESTEKPPRVAHENNEQQSITEEKINTHIPSSHKVGSSTINTSVESPMINREEIDLNPALVQSKEVLKSQIRDLIESVTRKTPEKNDQKPSDSLQELEDQLKRNLVNQRKRKKFD